MKQFSPQKLPYVRNNRQKRLEALKLEAERSKELARLSEKAQQPDGGCGDCRPAAGKQKTSGF